MSACMTCGKPTPLHLLDAKPKECRGGPITPEHEHKDFDLLECRTCYGPGWVEGVRENYLGAAK